MSKCHYPLINGLLYKIKNKNISNTRKKVGFNIIYFSFKILFADIKYVLIVITKTLFI